jgi:hypothetical protein
VDPPLRDTSTVFPFGWTAVRFVADNPGVWQFHCHIKSHQVMGMNIFFVEAAEEIPPPPPEMPLCEMGTAQMPRAAQQPGGRRERQLRAVRDQQRPRAPKLTPGMDIEYFSLILGLVVAGIVILLFVCGVRLSLLAYCGKDICVGWRRTEGLKEKEAGLEKSQGPLTQSEEKEGEAGGQPGGLAGRTAEREGCGGSQRHGAHRGDD